MNVEIITIYEVHGDSGGETGIGPIIGYTRTRGQADIMAKNRGWYGGTGWICETKGIVVDSVVYALVSDSPIDLDGIQKKFDEDLRASTIASLSKDQLRVLGIK